MAKYQCLMKDREGRVDRVETFCSESDEAAYARAVMVCAEAEMSPVGGAELWSGGRLVRALPVV
jgi:hypothetical protein